MGAANEIQKEVDDTEEATHRLVGMVVKEVSLVDRAANKRVFLVMKRQGHMSDQTSTAKDGSADPGAAGEPPAGGDAAPAGAGGAMQAQVKDGLLQALTGAAEKLVTVANTVKDAETTEEATTPPVPEAVVGAIGEVASMLQDIASQYGAGAPGDKAAATDAASSAAATAAPTTGAPMEAAKREVLAKVGRKMAKERLDRLKKAIDLLASIWKELSLDVTRKRAAGSAPVAVTTVEAAAIVASMEDVLAIAKSQTDELAALKKANVTAAAEIERLKKATASPNSLPVEGSTPTAPKRVVWPMDMAPKRPANGAARR